MLNQFAEQAIKFNYPPASTQLIDELDQQSEVVEISPWPGFWLENAYFKQGFPGTQKKVLARHAVLIRLIKLVELITPKYGLYIFDVFRTRETQRYLFETFHEQIKAKHPTFTEEQLYTEVRKYVSHPDEPARFAAPPHNTGGAIDLAFYDQSTGKVLDYGSDIDQTDDISRTDYFEQAYTPASGMSEQRWLLIRKNRRILFNAMIQLNFTNFTTEWWHYDLGDALWAQNHQVEDIYLSME
jgi:D-alanyl-D-alanine dipeptidase